MGGSLAPVWVAGFTWNGWQPSAVYAPNYVHYHCRPQQSPTNRCFQDLLINKG